MLGRVPPEKLVAILLVAVLHLLLVWFLVEATLVEIKAPRSFHVAPITLWLRPAPIHKKPEPKAKENFHPLKPAPAPVEHAKGPATPPTSAPPPTSDYNGLRALGRYLDNCSAGRYWALSNRELAHCLGNHWDKPDDTKRLRLGKMPPSIWEREMKRRKAPPGKVEGECPLGSQQNRLGMPCYHFGN